MRRSARTSSRRGSVSQSPVPASAHRGDDVAGSRALRRAPLVAAGRRRSLRRTRRRRRPRRRPTPSVGGGTSTPSTIAPLAPTRITDGNGDLAARPEELGLALAAEVPVDVLQHGLLPRGRRVGRVGQRGAEVGVEDDRRASLLGPPRDVEHELAGALRDRHRDPGQVDDLHAVERLVRHVADAQPRGRRAGSAVGDVRLSLRAPLAEEARRRVVALHPARLDAFGRRQRRGSGRRRDRGRASRPRRRRCRAARARSQVGLGAREAQRQRHAEPQLAVLQRVEQRHRLAEREDPHARS